MTTLIFTFIGRDKPGVVESLAGIVSAGGGNWLESRMTHLAGQFAGIVRVEAEEWQAAPLRQALEAAQPTDGFQLIFHEAPSAAVPKPTNLVKLAILGQDRPGIVAQISRCVAGHGVNVEEFESSIRSAPMSGEPLFCAELTLGVHDSAVLQPLRQDLEKIANDLMVEVNLD